MADLTVVSPARAANALTGESAAAGGDAFANTGKELLVIENGSGSPINLTAVTQQEVDGEAVDDKVITIPAGERHVLGPWPTSIYSDGDSKVQLEYSAVTSVTVSVIKP